MKNFTIGFIISSLIYLILTAILGLIFLISSTFNYGLMVATVHALLLGFATMLVFGVNYHIIPMFSGRSFYSQGLAYVHLTMANLGIVGMLLPLPFSNYPGNISLSVKLSSILFAVSIFVFIYNMMRTFMSPVSKEPPPNPFGAGDKAADKMAIRFTAISMVYLIIGCPLGVFFLLRPDYIPYLRPVHVHINLIGFISIMIFGVSYHMFPRFAAKPLFSVWMGKIQFWLVNIGLIGIVLSWWFFETGSSARQLGLIIFAIIEAIAVVLYIYNCWKTLSRTK